MAVRIITESPFVVGGYGLLFGPHGNGEALQDADTEYMLNLVPRKPVLIDHGGDPVGTVLHESADEHGIYIAAWLHNIPGDLVRDMQAGRVGWSRGLFMPLYKSEHGRAVRAPIVEYSLTRTPADPRQIGGDVDPETARRAGLRIVVIDQDGQLVRDNAEPIDRDVVRRLASAGYSVTVFSENDPGPEFRPSTMWRTIK